ncbi:CBS domain-containing protein [Streptosporangium fragile]|uniref:CBS domain-containing protein n=1 Tax=Streptosporangium fragile TaxID=46186 RepID=A0ABN3VTI5_9ACTN
MPIKVSDVMGRVPIAVRQDAHFADILDMMKRYAVGAVTVVDADRRPVGVVSQDDLLLKETDPVRHRTTIFESAARRREHEKAAGSIAMELMTSPAITVTPGTSVRDAARLMHDRRIGQLPVIDPVTGRIVGTVHQGDLLRVFERPAAELLAEIRETIRDVAGEDLDGLTVEIERGAVRLGGEVGRASQAVRLVEAVRRLEGVVDVVSELRHRGDDVAVAPPMY